MPEPAFKALSKPCGETIWSRSWPVPRFTAVDGRPASFNVGGEIPILVPSGLGMVSVQYRSSVRDWTMLPRCWVTAESIWRCAYVSEIDPSRSVTLSGVTVPGLRSRFLETGVELNAGQTLALGGLLQAKTEVINSGLPGLAEIPYLGVFFRKVREERNEIELLITVTPDFSGALDPHEVPPVVPGISTVSPTDKELYFKGYMEVPREDCQPSSHQHYLIDQPPPAVFQPAVSSNQGSAAPGYRAPAISIGPHADAGRIPFQCTYDAKPAHRHRARPTSLR